MSEILNSGMIESRDFEQHSEALAPVWQVNFNQLSKGSFQADLQYLQTNSFLLYTEQWNQRLQVEGESPEGYLMLGATSAPDFIWDGSPVRHNQLAFKHSKEALDFSISGNHTVILVPHENLSAIIGEERSHALLSNEHMISSDTSISTEFSRTVRQLVEGYHRSTRVNHKAKIAAQVDLEVSNLLNNVVHLESNEQRQNDQSFRRASLVRALHLTRNLRHPVAIAELAKWVGVSQRTLESAFLDSFGIPPTRYLRRMRLNQVRRDLRHSSATNTTITKIGSNWGFSELGRMAVEYRQLFGESPSETLAASPRHTESGLPTEMATQAT